MGRGSVWVLLADVLNFGLFAEHDQPSDAVKSIYEVR